MPPREEFGCYFRTQVPGHQNNIKCKLRIKVIKGIKHDETPPRWERKKIDSKKRKDEFETQLRGDTNEEDLDDYINEQARQDKQGSLNSQYEWEQRQHFLQQTREYENIYEQGGGDASRPQDINFNLRSTNVDLVRIISVKQTKITGRFMDTTRNKLREVVGKFIIYE
ncbi:hypothetical protein Lal_00003936 [Lupinus albus]|nr:hypothetical protein Lal_00003936 [Lupinus albus]